ncbi:MAG: hypothetical protein KDA63_13355 [Planctomycetales bacterium]|nr:hypothetical protein [Planctomycetales bacterium]
MRRLLLGALLALVAGGSLGCSTCYSPYDNCYPTYTGAPGESCCGPRRGSILDYGAMGGYEEVHYGPSEIIEGPVEMDGAVMPEASTGGPSATSARRPKLRPIPDRMTSWPAAGTVRR